MKIFMETFTVKKSAFDLVSSSIFIYCADKYRDEVRHTIIQVLLNRIQLNIYK